MHQTTVRFGADLWRELVREADRTGVSVAQYVRDATLVRLARNSALWDSEPGPIAAADTHASRIAYEDTIASSNALAAQAGLAQRRARRLRRDAEATRERSSRTPDT
jgi:hypothetical protein